MHPCWGIRRVTADTARKEGKTINCEFAEKTFTCVSIGAVSGDSLSMTVSVTVPVVSNAMKIQAGEELFLPMAVRVAPKKRAETWKDDMKKGKKPKASGAPAAAKGVMEI